MEKANVTLYTVIGDPNRIVKAIQERFKEMAEELVCEDETVDLTLPDGTHVIFSIKHRRSKPDFIASHTSGMANYFSQVKTPLAELKENVLCQIRVFNCVTGITFDLNDNEDRTNYILNRLFEIAGDVNGFLLYPSMQIFTSEGKLLFSAKGESQLTEFIPVGNADFLDGNRPEEAQADVERRLRSIALLEEKHIPYMEYLRSEVLESEARLRSRKEIVQRAAALFAVAVYSEVILSEDSGREEALFYFKKMEHLYGVESYLSRPKPLISMIPIPNGKSVFSSYGVTNVRGACFGRQALSTTSPIRPRLSMCPSWLLFSGNIKAAQDFFPKAFPVRSPKYWMQPILHFVTTGPVWMHEFMEKKLRLRRRGVVMERHYAFNWIIGANDGADWDDIQPNT